MQKIKRVGTRGLLHRSPDPLVPPWPSVLVKRDKAPSQAVLTIRWSVYFLLMDVFACTWVEGPTSLIKCTTKYIKQHSMEVCKIGGPSSLTTGGSPTGQWGIAPPLRVTRPSKVPSTTSPRSTCKEEHLGVISTSVLWRSNPMAFINYKHLDPWTRL
jgi:hypothetical protein